MLLLVMAFEILPELEPPLTWYAVIPLAGLEVGDPVEKNENETKPRSIASDEQIELLNFSWFPYFYS